MPDRALIALVILPAFQRTNSFLPLLLVSLSWSVEKLETQTRYLRPIDNTLVEATVTCLTVTRYSRVFTFFRLAALPRHALARTITTVSVFVYLFCIPDFSSREITVTLFIDALDFTKMEREKERWR